MIVAALCLVAVGCADIVRTFVPTRRRWIAYAIGAVLLVVYSAGVSAFPAALVAAFVAVGWVWTMPMAGNGRAGMWPVVALAVVGAVAVLAAPVRGHTGPLGDVLRLDGPVGPVSLDVVTAVAGGVVFLIESGNLIVRAALRQEKPGIVAEDSDLKGGRLIGPLERILVLGLTLAGAYTLLAAVLAAKGIVRFPEISGDRGQGTRAEYFLVGSLVSWVAAFAVALLVWWGSGGGWPLLDP